LVDSAVDASRLEQRRVGRQLKSMMQVNALELSKCCSAGMVLNLITASYSQQINCFCNTLNCIADVVVAMFDCWHLAKNQSS